MNKIIDNELKKVLVADLSHYDSATRTYHIPQYKEKKFKVGECYIILLDDYITNPIDNIVAINWNQGSIPNSSCYKIEITKVLGKMVFVEGLAYDYSTKQNKTSVWSGWLPIEHFKIADTL